MPKSFSVEVCDRGLIVRGSVSILELSHLGKMGEEHGFDLMDAALSGALKVTMVITNKDQSEKWRAEIQERQNKLMLDPEGDRTQKIDLYLGTASEQYLDAGASSKSLLRIVSGRFGDMRSVPLDAEDFGRCVRMLNLLGYEGWEQKSYPNMGDWWTKLQANWERLSGLYASGHRAVLGAELRKLCA